ncbi:GTPase [Azoarcus sp. DD4]|uniref:YcjF family protein n=1 Tax=Azoarcus sp. DD4 TaxID=2027405 RepID=UPI0011294E96|nr:TerB family tellurite resistance protein [Azoarcus sp. DD4]QDF96497.1 GTPase [Azoarcus sp. DD4]
MQAQQNRAILAICLLAAFADNRKDDREREHIRRVAESLSRDANADLIGLYQDVLLKRIRLEDQAAMLDSTELRQLAYEMAVGVCDADGVHDAAEAAFLERLSAALGLDRKVAAQQLEQADAIAALPLDTGTATDAPASTTDARAATPDRSELERMILNAAILNGALELLPQSLASMAIIPLQTRLVYRVGKAHGYELDRGHITDFLATVGVGLTSQYVEQFGRKLIGGLLGKVLGKTGKTIGSAATGSAFSFASTYALGHVAIQYYGGGRTLDGAALKNAFAGLLGEARSLQQRYTPEIEQRARNLDVGKLMTELRA